MTPRLPTANYTVTHHDETCWDYQKLNHWTVFACVFKVKVIVAYKFYNFFKHVQPLKRFLQQKILVRGFNMFQPISKIGSSIWIIFPKVRVGIMPRWPTWFHGFIRHFFLRRRDFLGSNRNLELCGRKPTNSSADPPVSRSLPSPGSRVDPWGFKV